MEFFPVKRQARQLQRDSFYRRLTITVPDNTPWDAQKAERLCASLFNTIESVSLRISVDDEGIHWSILAPKDVAKLFRNTLYTYYPKAYVADEPITEHPDVGALFFGFSLEDAHVIPIQPVTLFKSVAPIGSVISALSNVMGMGHFTYVIYLGRLPAPAKEAGINLLVKSDLHWAHFLTMKSATSSFAKKSVGEDLQAALPTTTIQKYAEEKAFGNLKLARVGLLVHDANGARRHGEDIANCLQALDTAFSGLSFHGANKLARPRKDRAGFHVILTAAELASLWHLPNELVYHPSIKWREGVFAEMPAIDTRERPYVSIGLSEDRHGVREVPVFYEDRVSHVNIVGKTRMGKSTLMLNMAKQDIAAGHGVAVIDPHGDLVNDIIRRVIPKSREKDVILFRARDIDYPMGLSLFSVDMNVKHVGEQANYILNYVKKNFEGNWSESRMEDTLYNVLYSLCCYPGATLMDVVRLLQDDVYRSEVIGQVTSRTVRDFWRYEYDMLSDRERRDVSRPITSRVRKFFRSETVENILCQQTSLNMRWVMDTKKIFLADLGDVPESTSRVLGSLLITKLQMAGMSRSDSDVRVPFYTYVDEVQNFITTTLAVVLSEAGKYGLSFVVANQFLDQLTGRTLSAIKGNVGTTVIFRVGEDDAKRLASLVTPTMSAQELSDMSRYTAAVKMQASGVTQKAFTTRTEPPPLLPSDADERVRRIVSLSRAKYAKPKASVEEELDSRDTGPTTSKPDSDENEAPSYVD